MSNYNFLDKELVKTMSYSNVTEDRMTFKRVVFKGREYFKFGTLQVVTIVGNVYKIFNEDSGQYDYLLVCGLSKQHPNDRNIDKNIALEIANDYSLNDPFMVMKVNKQFGRYTFRDMMKNYVNDMDLEFIKTTAEIEDNDEFKNIA